MTLIDYMDGSFLRSLKREQSTRGAGVKQTIGAALPSMSFLSVVARPCVPVASLVPMADQVWLSVPGYDVFSLPCPEGRTVNALRNDVVDYLRLELAPPLLRVFAPGCNEHLDAAQPIPASSRARPLKGLIMPITGPGIWLHSRIQPQRHPPRLSEPALESAEQRPSLHRIPVPRPLLYSMYLEPFIQHMGSGMLTACSLGIKYHSGALESP